MPADAAQAIAERIRPAVAAARRSPEYQALRFPGSFGVIGLGPADPHFGPCIRALTVRCTPPSSRSATAAAFCMQAKWPPAIDIRALKALVLIAEITCARRSTFG
ncbi:MULTISPECIES: hypothetical protein [unclassified Acidovorax]|uniref:hypothetical protein n=1 Tax=unclassified Acidovorax TaxID=2684926 RepID=UPI0011787396|nr:MULTISPECIES: hypothetical protein [unclassified Acidovorax]MBU4424348.1 hypothetical protein [Gammaproteobacteria bacterium]